MLSKISYCALFCFLGCGNSEISNSSSESSGFQEPDENITPTEGIECTNDFSCDSEEICFEGQCQYYRAIIYKITILKYVKFDEVCADYKYEVKLDGQLVPIWPEAKKASSTSKCGGEWPTEWFEMVGDQIPEIGVWNIGLLNKKTGGFKVCWYDGKNNCQQLPLKVFKNRKIHYVNQVYDVQMSIEPIKSLDVDLGK